MADGESNAEAGTRGAKEDSPRGLDELMPARRPARDPGISILPNQLRLGDRFTDADGEWEVVSRPVTFKQGHEVRARVQQPGDPGAVREKYRAAHERITIRRNTK